MGRFRDAVDTEKLSHVNITEGSSTDEAKAESLTDPGTLTRHRPARTYDFFRKVFKWYRRSMYDPCKER